MSIFKKLKNALVKKAFVLLLKHGPKQEYTALKPDPTRAKPKIRYDDTVTEQSFRADLRIQAYAISNDLYDNDDVGSILESNIRLAIGQKGGIPIFTGDGAKEAQDLFDEWKKHADYIEGKHWNWILKLILRTVKLHGDCLICMDPDFTDNKIRIWDSDQVCNLEETAFRQFCDEFNGYDDVVHNDETRWKQVEGSVTHRDGRVIGYFVTSRRNQLAVRREDATFLPIGFAQRVSDDKEITQYRGEPLFLPNSELTADSRTLIKSEVMAAKIHAELPLVHKKHSNVVLGDIDGLSASQAVEGTDIKEEDIDKLKAKADEMTNFKAFEGKAAIGEIGPDDELINLDNGNRPSIPIQQWMDKLNDTNGKRLGVMSCLSRGRADNSYSSAQVELSVSWASFEDDQKMLERQVVDYVCAILCPGVKYKVTWPEAFEVDPQKAEATKDARLRGGRTDFEEQLGPYWKTKLQKLADQKKFLEEKGLTNLSFFQSVSGAQADKSNDDNDNDNDNDSNMKGDDQWARR